MRYIVERNFVRVLGTIWLVPIRAAMEYPLSRYDAENIGEFTRENVARWLLTHAGDFQHVEDFWATLGDAVIEWANPESEGIYFACVGDSEPDAGGEA